MFAIDNAAKKTEGASNDECYERFSENSNEYGFY
jgi:hypothetical protein